MVRKNENAKMRRVLDALVDGTDLNEVLKENGISEKKLLEWLGDEPFCELLRLRIDTMQMQGQFLLAKYATAAAARLIALTEADNDETKRKACLDILKLQDECKAFVKQAGSQEGLDSDAKGDVSDEAAAAILSVLSGDNS